jgi:hypothetical protein
MTELVFGGESVANLHECEDQSWFDVQAVP